MSAAKEKKSLPVLVEKTFLELLEKRKKELKDITSDEICDGNEVMFGHPSTDLRRNVQYVLRNLKKRTIRSYVKHLDKFKVSPGDVTARLLREQGRCPSPLSAATSDNNSDVVSTSNDNEELKSETNASVGTSKSSDVGSGENYEEELADKFEKKVKLSNSSSCTPTNKSDTYVSPFVYSLPKNSSNKMIEKIDVLPSSPAPTASISTVSSSSFEGHSFLGSLNNPWTYHVDLSHPERHSPFQLEHLVRIEHNGWAWQGIDIRKAVDVEDKDLWTAWVDQSLGLEYEERVIMIKGCALSTSYFKTEEYHRKPKVSDLKAAHQKTKICLSANPDRNAIYYRFVLPEGYKVDNAIISGNPTQIKKNKTGIKYEAGKKKMETTQFFVNWTVVKKGSGYEIDFDEEEADDECYD